MKECLDREVLLTFILYIVQLLAASFLDCTLPLLSLPFIPYASPEYKKGLRIPIGEGIIVYGIFLYMPLRLVMHIYFIPCNLIQYIVFDSIPLGLYSLGYIEFLRNMLRAYMTPGQYLPVYPFQRIHTVVNNTVIHIHTEVDIARSLCDSQPVSPDIPISTYIYRCE